MAFPRATLSRNLRSISVWSRSNASPSHHIATRQAFQQRAFHSTPHLDVVKPFLLADIGEGITECQLIQWFVQPGARVEQFDKLCEVQSDKASVEITSPFDGVIKKLHYEPDDMAITGKPLVDIDIDEEVAAENAEVLGGEGVEGKESGAAGAEGVEESGAGEQNAVEAEEAAKEVVDEAAGQIAARPPPKNDQRTLATPAVRHLTKEHGIDIADIDGTGKDGRVLKEDVQRYLDRSRSSEQPSTTSTAPVVSREDRKVPLTPVQNQMFKTMTRSLSIPHFLYTCAADISALTTLRKRLNASASSANQKLTHLPFILKAVSLAFQQHPLLNASLNTKDPRKPELTHKGSHNFGVAIDTPNGLLVPVMKNVQDLSISDIAAQLKQLSEKARNNKLTPAEFSGGTFTISNIGSVGGGVVSPVISEPQVAILGVGRSKIVPSFDENDVLVRREELTFSWSADHRVVDGAECARCAERVKTYLEEPAMMLAEMR